MATTVTRGARSEATDVLMMLDATLNALVLQGSPQAAHDWWVYKVGIKRALAELPDAYHDVVVDAVLRQIEREV